MAKAVICFVLAAFVAVLAGGLLFVSVWGPTKIHNLISNGIQSQIIVSSENSSSYSSWLDTRSGDSPPVHMKFYLFNITNPSEILKGAKPVLAEVGPYSYIEEKVKFNVSFLEGGSQVKYWEWEFFTFEANTSGPGLNPYTDVLTIVSLPYQAVYANLEKIKLIEPLSNYTFEFLVFLTGVTPFKTDTAHNLIFGNYTDPMLAEVAKHIPDTPLSVPLQVNQTSEQDGQTNTSYTIQYTGQGNLSLIHDYLVFNGATNLTFWGSADANVVRGSDGYNFAPNVNKSQPIELFVDNLMRKGNTTFNSTGHLFGIELYGFTLNPSQMQNTSENPLNAPYYAEGFPSGQLNMTAASQGVPLFVSKPHFLQADPVYLEEIDGISPGVVSEHDTVIWIEPITGVTMSSYKRLQINIRFEPIPPFKDIIPVYMPVLWIEEGGSLTEKLASEFKAKVYTARRIERYGPIAGFSIAGVLLLLVILLIVLGVRAHSHDGGDDGETAPLVPEKRVN